jgi:uncharacterized protein (TIGR00725 family)
MMKYKFVVSGSADTGFCSANIEETANALGREIVKHEGLVITGATTGFPYMVAKSVHKSNGVSVGISPAASFASHVRSYRLPIDVFDFIIYSGFGYSGRNLILTKSADAVIVGCGGFGTLNEFTIALEDEKPIGILTGTGGTAEEIATLLKDIKDPHHHGRGRLVFSNDPAELVRELVKFIDHDRKEIKVPELIGE